MLLVLSPLIRINSTASLVYSLCYNSSNVYQTSILVNSANCAISLLLSASVSHFNISKRLLSSNIQCSTFSFGILLYQNFKTGHTFRTTLSSESHVADGPMKLIVPSRDEFSEFSLANAANLVEYHIQDW